MSAPTVQMQQLLKLNTVVFLKLKCTKGRMQNLEHSFSEVVSLAQRQKIKKNIANQKVYAL